MTKIDPTRIAAVLRVLARPKPLTNVRENRPNAVKSINGALPHLSRDPDVLRQRLRKRLSQLKLDALNFEEKAPELTVREILIWEFGEEVLESYAFSTVVAAVVTKMCADEGAKSQLDMLLRQLTS